MTTKFAVNVIGYIEDPLDKYTNTQIEGMLDRKSITECFKPIHVIGVVTKQLRDPDSIPLKKVMKRRLGGYKQ